MNEDALVRAQYNIVESCIDHSFAQGDYAAALSKFQRLKTLDLCASVSHFREEPTGRPSLIFEDEFYEQHGAEPTPTNLLRIHERATLCLSHQCSRLRHVYWSAPWSNTDADITIWIWRIFGEEDLAGSRIISPGSAVCEAVGVRDNSWGLAYDVMKPWKLLRPFVVDGQMSEATPR